MAHQQEEAELAALETPEVGGCRFHCMCFYASWPLRHLPVISRPSFGQIIPVSEHLSFRAEETEMCACRRLLCPGTPDVAGLAERSPEGTEERRAP